MTVTPDSVTPCLGTASAFAGHDEERDYQRHERGDNRACNFEGQPEPTLHRAPALTRFRAYVYQSEIGLN
jgi:hypothetical protein